MAKKQANNNSARYYLSNVSSCCSQYGSYPTLEQAIEAAKRHARNGKVWLEGNTVCFSEVLYC
jgi:hypothetical protein